MNKKSVLRNIFDVMLDAREHQAQREIAMYRQKFDAPTAFGKKR